MKAEDKYKTLLVIVVGLGLLYFLFDNIYLLYTSLAIGTLSFMFPIVGDWILKGWGLIGHTLGYINTKILLSLVFFVFLTPIALIQKLLTKSNFLNLKNPEGSNYLERNQTYEAKDFDNPW